MDPIMEFANKHDLIVIEDVSHAQGGYYKGKKLGTFGKVAAMSMMSGKSLAAGECGMLVTDDDALYERAVCYGHYERTSAKNIHSEDLIPYLGLPLGGVKARLNQVSAAIGRVQLKHYDERCAEIDKAMNHFCDLLEGYPGIRPIRTKPGSGSTMGGWYACTAAYYPEQLHGLSAKRFCEAVTAEMNGAKDTWAGANFCLHNHNIFKTFDLTNAGAPTRIAHNEYDVRQDDDLCKKSEEKLCFSIPWFKHFDKEWIDLFASAYKKVAENYKELLATDPKEAVTGKFFQTARKN
jgi:dTDP-4-amino-4,6-dideoxygalactose transaminase